MCRSQLPPDSDNGLTGVYPDGRVIDVDAMLMPEYVLSDVSSSDAKGVECVVRRSLCSPKLSRQSRVAGGCDVAVWSVSSPYSRLFGHSG